MKINEKIKIACALHTLWAEALRADPAVLRGQEGLCAWPKSRAIFRAADFRSVPAAVTKMRGGLLRGAGIEDRYTPKSPDEPAPRS